MLLLLNFEITKKDKRGLLSSATFAGDARPCLASASVCCGAWLCVRGVAAHPGRAGAWLRTWIGLRAWLRIQDERGAWLGARVGQGAWLRTRIGRRAWPRVRGVLRAWLRIQGGVSIKHECNGRTYLFFYKT